MTKYTLATVAGFTEYHEDRGTTIPGTWDDAKIESALLIASEWIDRTYGAMFIGEKTDGYTQSREWPRINAVIKDVRYTYVIPNNEVPQSLIFAVYEAAYRHAANPGSLLVDYTPNKYKSVSISGAVSVDYNLFTFSSEVQNSFPVIDQLLNDLLDSRDSFASYSGSIERV